LSATRKEAIGRLFYFHEGSVALFLLLG
jgi:hypothetical protein